ncbi:MFS transporter [Teredinibacter haidensis]|uniref:MFS transporter n=1 Tax=Teredinibacter haidensis TaxID=2731755 RepID=UPI000948A9EF|nr:MFS transporter [Teredinibacter haidensis]
MISTLKLLPKNIWVIALALALLQGAMPLLVLISGIVGATLAPAEDLATLPMAIAVVGVACATVPAALLAQKWGRKQASFLGMMLAFTGVNLCALSAWLGEFYLLLSGTFLVGTSGGFYQQLRFAAIESLEDANNIGPALSVLMISGIVAGLLGPELAGIAKHLSSSASANTVAFLLMGILIALGALVFSQFHNPKPKLAEKDINPRPLIQIVLQPLFLVAVLASLVGYVVMVFLMTSTPISMHLIQGHSIEESKWVIQSHIVAMFLPSLFTGFLIKRFGAAPLLICGSILYLAVIAVASRGHEVIHYWWALVLLGIGWNFLFVSGTTILPKAYRENERFKAQAVNDFTIFSSQAIASLTAGWVLFNYGWSVQLLLCLPITFVCLIACIFYWKYER